MTAAKPAVTHDRPQVSARSLLSREYAFRTRAPPQLNQVRRSVSQILERWPDAIKPPMDGDRERLALEMLRRVSDWDWKEVTTQRVLSAAVAIFDKERRTRPDLQPVRKFYLSGIGTCDPGAFLNGMLTVYLDSFAVDADHTRDLAEALAMRTSDIDGRHRKLMSVLPEIFRPDAAPLALARIMRKADHAYMELKSVGLSSPHASGLAQTAQKTFFDDLAPDLSDAEARRRLFNWLTPENGPVLQVGAARAVEALLTRWQERTPPDDLRNELSEAIIAAWGDPRLRAGGIWSNFDPTLRAVLLRWLTHQDMKFFCDMVTATQDNHMWPPRRDFWLKLHRNG
ncbi:EH signature domain-containing protein [uncultured Paracoccus sp.]|uniref:EH signature domain-containing protein n=1 Tax=uncultured Paracoccus sp. TaxID=189685 RepID=UPI0025FE4B28|nr:EH signature domain-containing protein [uncultured Paracoccus sp.]